MRLLIYDPKQKQNGRPADQNKETSRGNISVIKLYLSEICDRHNGTKSERSNIKRQVILLSQQFRIWSQSSEVGMNGGRHVG